jgi:hypothetical protein
MLKREFKIRRTLTLGKDYAFTRPRLTRVKLYVGGDISFHVLEASTVVTAATAGQTLLKTNEVTASWLNDKWLQGDTGSNTNTFICISVSAFQIRITS